MIRIREGRSRGTMRNDWLDARFTFSFGPYREPAYDGYSDLLVLNDDRVAPGGGFASHSHSDIEAITYMLSGEVEHRDNLGNVARIRAGDAHRMTAGRGITHSEMNASRTEPEHHLQIWIRPERASLDPGYEQRSFGEETKRGRLQLIASRDGREGSLVVNQNANLYAGIAGPAGIEYAPPAFRRTYLHVARGAILLNGRGLGEGDGAFVDDEARLSIVGGPKGEIVLADLR